MNTQEAIMECNEGKKEFTALQAKFSPKEAALKKLDDEVANLKKQYDIQKDKLKPEVSASQLKAIEAKQKTLQRSFDNDQKDFQRAAQGIIDRIGPKMMKVIEKYAKSRGYTLVLDIANPQTPVLYMDQGMNITKELIQAYNAENPVAPPQVFSKDLATPTTPRFTAPGTQPKKP